MEVGKHYRVYDTKGEFWIIFKPLIGGQLDPDNEYRCDEGYTITSTEMFSNNGCCYKSVNGSRDYCEATEEEAGWLEYCIEKNKYMSKEWLAKE